MRERSSVGATSVWSAGWEAWDEGTVGASESSWTAGAGAAAWTAPGLWRFSFGGAGAHLLSPADSRTRPPLPGPLPLGGGEGDGTLAVGGVVASPSPPPRGRGPGRGGRFVVVNRQPLTGFEK